VKHKVIAMKVHDGESQIVENEERSNPIPMKLPNGCTGILFVFETKKAAREYWGNDTELLRVEDKS